MKKAFTLHSMRAVLALLIMMLTANTGWAQTLSGSGTAADPYLIQNDADWVTFAELINNSSTNSTYCEKFYKQTADINVSTMVGMSNYYFKGNYDGGGHTMNVSLTSTEEYCAPFRYVNSSLAKDCVIKSLHVTGSITSSNRYVGGIVGYSQGSTTKLYNCWSSVTLTCSFSQSYTNINMGGLISECENSLEIKNCLFDGILVCNGEYSRGCGGYVGYMSNQLTLRLTNCLFNPIEVSISDEERFWSYSERYNYMTNCYYTMNYGNTQGLTAGGMTNSELKSALGQSWEISNNKVVPVLSSKDLRTGNIECESFYAYTGSEITVTPTVKDLEGNVIDNTNYTASISPNPVQALGEYTLTITGTGNYQGSLTHTLTVDQQLPGSGTQDNPYTIATTAQWNQFADIVALGHSYEGEFVKLNPSTSSISINTMVGNRNHPFSGTFDGNYKTINANINSSATGDEIDDQGVAPFHYIYTATIKNLKVAGSITSASKYTGGLVGFADSRNLDASVYHNHIENCLVTATLHTPNISDDYVGGFVGSIQPNNNVKTQINFQDCAFVGTIISGNSETKAGGLFGRGYECCSYIDNCLEKGTYTNITNINPRGAASSFSPSAVTSLYYVKKTWDPNDRITEANHCYLVSATAPDALYKLIEIREQEAFLQSTVSNLVSTYPYNNGDAVPINYTLKAGPTVLEEGTDFETVIKDSNNETVLLENLKLIGNYTIHFVALLTNTNGYTGETVCSFQILEGESLDGYVFQTEGEGENKYYKITNVDDLERLAAYVNSGHNASDLTFKLTEDITFDQNQEHTAIGSQSYSFKGTFDGCGHTITNLKVNQPTVRHQGLFGYLRDNAKIKDVTLNNCQITGGNYTGGIAGYTWGHGTSNSNRVYITGCHVNGTIAATENDGDYHGGIVGSNNDYLTIEDCTVSGTISSTVSNDYYGGILGFNGGYIQMTRCENAANITCSGTYHGGIVGNDNNYSSDAYTNCFNKGEISGNSYIGGLSGSSSSTRFANCYYASPCTKKAFNNSDYPGHGESVYKIIKGNHITSISFSSNPTHTYHCNIDDTDYYKKGNWTLTLTPEAGYTFVKYNCEGGALTNLNVAAGDHILTISNQDVIISAYMSNSNATDLSGATIADIAPQRWLGNIGVEPALTVTLGSTLTQGEDYIVEWNNNTTIGENVASATVVGINGYSGTTQPKYFTIEDFPTVDPSAPYSYWNNPYAIATAADLEALACIVNSKGRTSSTSYKQTADIDLNGIEHTPIGCSTQSFTGMYDGDGKKISNLTINSDQVGQGLFGYTYSGHVKNVKLENCNISGKQYVGGIIGHASSGSVTNCIVTGNVSSSANGLYYFGGIEGYSEGSIENCFSAVNVTGPQYVGSIAGNGNYTSFTNNHHPLSTTGGVGSANSTTGTDQTGAEVVVKITAGENVSMTLPTPTRVWDEEDLYVSGTTVTLNCTVPDNKYFSLYSVNSGNISDAGVKEGEHTLTGFSENVVISRNYVDSQTDLTSAVVTNIPTHQTYNGQEQHPVPVVTLNEEVLIENTHYSVSYSGDCMNVNDNNNPYSVIVTGIGAYTGMISTDYYIDAFNLGAENAIVISGIYDKYAKTGSEIHPVPSSVKCDATNDATLVLNSDYSLTYSTGCIQPGDYTITLTGINNYTGTKDMTFRIMDVSTLTVHDKLNTCATVPVYGGNAEFYNKCEMVMPASELTAMSGKAITTMQFYLRSKASGSWGDARFRVFMKEVDFTSYESPNDSYKGTDGATIVYEGPLDGTQNIMTVNFTTPYKYNGGNLLIGVYEYQKGSWKSTSFYGEDVTGASVGGLSSSNLDDCPLEQRGFLPKTTFWYSDYENQAVSAYTSDTDGWKFIASPLVYDVDPVDVSHLIDATPANYDLYRFNQSGANSEWENYKAHTEGFVLENGKGYLYSRSSATTLSFNGTLNVAASKEVALDYDGNAEFAGWNLIGNPFNAEATIDRPYYVMNAEGTGILAESVSGSTPIDPCTGVLVQATALNQSATFTKASQSNAKPNHGNLNIALTQSNTRSNAVLDKAIISFNGSKLGKFYFGEQNANIYIQQDGEEFAIVSADMQGEMPVNFKANKDGEYTITVNAENAELNYLHLIDNIAGANIDLLQTPSYTFEGNKSDFDSRFRLVFRAGYSNENFGFIDASGNLMILGIEGEATLQVIDVTGRILSSETFSGNYNKTVNEAAGVYMLRLIQGENVRTQKIVVR